MPEKDLHITTVRMLKLIDTLQKRGVITFALDFYNAIGLRKQNIRQIKIGNSDFTLEQIRLACKTYNVSADWIFGLSRRCYNKTA